ncbi:hypothetical protein CL628_02360, partial [bacterium]|nr:hypothetical protein [bacterium]
APLRELADAHGLLLIEDMAHSLRGGAAPLVGHIGVLSFGRDKIISSVFGGAVVTHDTALLTKIERAQAALALPPRGWVAQQLLHPLLMAIVKRWYFMGLGKWILVAAQRLRLLSKAVALRERAGAPPIFHHWRYSPALAVLLVGQLAKLDTFTQRRITTVNQYAERIAAVRGWRDLPLLRVPLRVKEKTALLLQARDEQLMLGDWYRVAVEPCSLEQLELVGYVPGSCPRAEIAAREVINLPTHPTMHPTEAQQVINFLREHGNISS